MLFAAIYLVMGNLYCFWRYRPANYLYTQVHWNIIILALLILGFGGRRPVRPGSRCELYFLLHHRRSLQWYLGIQAHRAAPGEMYWRMVFAAIYFLLVISPFELS